MSVRRTLLRSFAALGLLGTAGIPGLIREALAAAVTRHLENTWARVLPTLA